MKVDERTAAEWLSTMGHQRNISPARVRRYQRAIVKGRWVTNGASIVFNGKGRTFTGLQDGQHRLMAHVQAADILKRRVVLEYLVVRGMGQDVFQTIDDNKPRYGSDTLSVERVKFPRHVAAALQFLHQLHNGIYTQGGATSLTNDEVLRAYKRNRELVVSAQAIAEMQAMPGLVQPSVAVGLHYLFAEKHKTQADKFMRALLVGEGTTKGCAELVLRNQLIRMKTTKMVRPKRMVKAAMVIIAWNIMRGKDTYKKGKGKQGIHFDYNSDSFPEIL
jgi:hypothetical protein